MSAFFDLAAPEKVTVGTIGEVGQRTFYVQAREGASLVTLKAEKQQVAALAQHLAQLLQDLPRPGELPSDDELELEAFEEEAFVVGTLGDAYDVTADRIMVLIEERVDEEDDSGDEARLAITREQASAIAIHGTRLVESGRPPCPLCGFPLDPRGHACPRTNGHQPPLR